jgi:hypothetical protein
LYFSGEVARLNGIEPQQHQFLLPALCKSLRTVMDRNHRDRKRLV